MPDSDIRRHEAFRSTWLERERDITVYLPPGYDTQRAAPYPALILHDGQNLFDPARAYSPGHHWRVAETADALIGAGTLPPLVIVGLDHASEHRVREYTPTPGREPEAGLAARHTHFVVDEVLPFVQREYGVSERAEDLGLGGSSLGALASVYVASAAPGIFGRLLLMSPSVWWDRRVILDQLRRAPLEGHPRVWLDIGWGEGAGTVRDTRRLRSVLRDQADVHYVEDDEGDHSEDSWARRFGDALVYLFGVGAAPE